MNEQLSLKLYIWKMIIYDRHMDKTHQILCMGSGWLLMSLFLMRSSHEVVLWSPHTQGTIKQELLHPGQWPFPHPSAIISLQKFNLLTFWGDDWQIKQSLLKSWSLPNVNSVNNWWGFSGHIWFPSNGSTIYGFCDLARVGQRWVLTPAAQRRLRWFFVITFPVLVAIPDVPGGTRTEYELQPRCAEANRGLALMLNKSTSQEQDSESPEERIKAGTHWAPPATSYGLLFSMIVFTPW